MLAGFTGTYHQKVDGKGRVSIPADHRRVIEAGQPNWQAGESSKVYLVFGNHLDGYIEAYTVEEYVRITSQIKAMKRSNPMRERLMRMFAGKSLVVDVDANGRAILNKQLREKLGVSDEGAELMFVGLIDHFEIRLKDQADIEEAEDAAWLEEQGDDFDLMACLDEE
ncbi:MraZ, putative [Oceanicola granulosus HTCC2516]|uniref:Transcriptional regulator MraZ n=1 Tax=Oceanicola granulosus (strain ATCC BAA-861 / DSM 15982 / KCTC 12143 / HTCC2516) TaxID=314256 RepID=Q2CII6_OCEGH|nr:MraZ, putative [Oceanicola granulosus]EAR52603.1 MraZ, putative [Oceanicola granulosus HTCC2516]